MGHPVFAANNTALITGAASGVGLAIAQLCRRHGMHLALVDNQANFLAQAKSSLSSGSQSRVETFEMDVSDLQKWSNLKEQVKKTFGGVDLLVLNAGIALKGNWEDSEYFRKIFDVNFFGQIYGLNTMLPLVRSQGKKTAVVMTGSKQGITNPPGNAAYNATKSAVKTVAEQLSYELRDTSTSVHLLVPGWTFTGLSGGHPGSEKAKPAGAWAPSQVASYLEEKMAAGQFYVLCPDNDVTEDKDRRRMLWGVGDAVYGRPPLSRWRNEYKLEAEDWMEEQQL